MGTDLYYPERLAINPDNIEKLSSFTAEMNEPDVALYAWITDNAGMNGLAFKGTACHVGPGKTKTSMTRGPSRWDAIVETAEVPRNPPNNKDELD